MSEIRFSVAKINFLVVGITFSMNKIVSGRDIFLVVDITFLVAKVFFTVAVITFWWLRSLFYNDQAHFSVIYTTFSVAEMIIISVT